MKVGLPPTLRHPLMTPDEAGGNWVEPGSAKEAGRVREEAMGVLYQCEVVLQ